MHDGRRLARGETQFVLLGAVKHVGLLKKEDYTRFVEKGCSCGPCRRRTIAFDGHREHISYPCLSTARLYML